jgi:adenylate cyclase
MAELVARRGDSPQVVGRWPLSAGVPLVLGRDHSNAEVRTDLRVPDESCKLSRRHVELRFENGRLTVQRRAETQNRVYFQGDDQKHNAFAVRAGESFVIGDFRFTLEGDAPTVGSEPAPPDMELTCSREELRQVRFVDADARIEILARLPEVIRFSFTDEDLETRVLRVLLDGIPQARFAGVVSAGPAGSGEPEVGFSRQECLDPGELHYSRRLVAAALCEQKQGVLCRWNTAAAGEGSSYTVSATHDWALCVPLPDDAPLAHGLYVAGRFEAPVLSQTDSAVTRELKGNLKFAELVADIFGSLRKLRDLQTRHALFGRFLPRPVLAELARRGADLNEVLRRRKTPVTVLFCDLRGSCLAVEGGSGDLEGTWSRVSDALDIMTSNIVDQDGVVGDFQGDAAMGFWGWPHAPANAAERAARAALQIQRDFARARDRGQQVGQFLYGIGIASGEAIAGKLGTYDQFKVGAFGPVVNLASRLEGMTKLFHVPILVDEATAAQLGSVLPRLGRTRRVARVRPAGMTVELTVSELLPLETDPGALPEQARLSYERALECVQTGQWSEALRRLKMAKEDGAATFLRDWVERQRQPPEGWNGVIVLDSKGG